MNEKNIMNATIDQKSALDHALQQIGNGHAYLASYLFNASAVESLVIMPLIGDAQRLINQINALIAAKKET